MQALINQIEAQIHRDVGRGMQAVFQATQGGLFAAASALAADPAPRIGLITGFFVPNGHPPAAETDGPPAAALLARSFRDAGIHHRLATDTICHAAVRTALDHAGAQATQLDAIPPDGDTAALIETWRADNITWVLAIERCGPAADGIPRNMRGSDISAHVAPLENLFTAGPWQTIGIGDGGNEIGMGRIPRPLIEGHVPHGARIGCVIPADHLITAGVSHWGAYALLAALSTLRPSWASAMLGALDPALDQAILQAMVENGPAVDGVTLMREPTIDGQQMSQHYAVLTAIRACLPANVSSR